jgi:hypothetical protein
MQTYEGMEVKFHTFLTAAVDAGEWSASRSGRFVTEGKSPIPILQVTGWTPKPVIVLSELSSVCFKKMLSFIIFSSFVVETCNYTNLFPFRREIGCKNLVIVW